MSVDINFFPKFFYELAGLYVSVIRLGLFFYKLVPETGKHDRTEVYNFREIFYKYHIGLLKVIRTY